MSDLNEQAVQAAEREMSRLALTEHWSPHRAVEGGITAYLADLKRQGIVLVEQPTKPCEKCGGSGKARALITTDPLEGRDACPDCNGSDTVPVVLVDVQEVVEALREQAAKVGTSGVKGDSYDGAADFVLRRFAPESTDEARDASGNLKLDGRNQ
jgi:hypothetical protein